LRHLSICPLLDGKRTSGEAADCVRPARLTPSGHERLLLLRCTALICYTPHRPSNREVEHVPAYSHSNRWVGVGGACSDKWIVIGELRGSQGNRNYRRGPVRLGQRFRNESGAAAST